MKTLVLIHGAWHGSWCWKKLTPLLTAAGNTVITPDVPWIFENKTYNRKFDLKTIGNELSDLISCLDGKVILVGHSMAGLIVSMLTAIIPEKILTAVYICGFIPKNSQTINDLEHIMADSIIAPNMVLDKNKQAIIIPENFLKQGFYHDCNDRDYQFAKSRIQPQLAKSFISITDIDMKISSDVRKIYIECLNDKAVPINAQRCMQKNISFAEVVSIPCGHSAFFSCPGKLANILLS